MPFVQAKCENCGSLLSVDSNLKVANCPNCGTAYIVQDANNYYNSVTNIEHLHADSVTVSSGDSLEGKIKAAEGYMMLGKYYEAYCVYITIKEHVPQDYRGWWGMIEAATNRLDPMTEPQIVTHTSYFNEGDPVYAFKQLDDFAVSVKKLAPPSISEECLKKYREYRSSYIAMKEKEINKTIESVSVRKDEIQRLDKKINQIDSELLHVNKLKQNPNEELVKTNNQQKVIRDGHDIGTKSFAIVGAVFGLLFPIGLIMLLFTRLGIVVALVGIIIPIIGVAVGSSKRQANMQQLELKKNNIVDELDNLRKKENNLVSEKCSLCDKKKGLEKEVNKQNDNIERTKVLIDYLVSNKL